MSKRAWMALAAAEGHIGGSDFDDDVCVLGVEYGEEEAETPGQE